MRAIRVAIAGAAAVAAMLAVAPTVATAAAAAPAAVGGAGAYYPLTPSRILDTRSGLGAPTGAVGPGGVLHLQVSGRGGVPATGVAAVVLNMTVVSPTAASYLTVWPTGSSRPTVSNIDFPSGWTGANSTTVSLGNGGQVDIYNLTGNVQIVADVVGFYASDASAVSTLGDGTEMFPAEPFRAYDTRQPGYGGSMVSGETVSIPVDFGSVDNATIEAMAVNLTVVNPKGSGYLTTWSGQGAHPATSTLDYAAGKTLSNMTIVPVTRCPADSTDCYPSFSIYNLGATTDVLADVFAVYEDTAVGDGLRFVPMSPVRIIDTRKGLGGHGALGANATDEFIPPSSVSNYYTFALAANITAVSPTADTYLTAWESDDSRQPVSNLDPAKGSTVCNTAPISLGVDGGFDMYNLAGTTNVLVDVEGRFDLPADATANARVASPATSARVSPRAVLGHPVSH